MQKVKRTRTLIYSVRRVYNEQCEVPAKNESAGVSDKIMIDEKTHKKNPWVVDNVHPRVTSSVVVTFVQVMHKETT
jgi:hypothetical protein